MSKHQHFQPLQYTLIIRDQVGHKLTGTGSIYDLEGTRTLAASVFRVDRRAAFVDIHPYIEGGSYTGTALETTHRSGATVAPLPPLAERQSEQSATLASIPEVAVEPVDQVEAPVVEIIESESSPDIPVEQTPVESSPDPRRRDRRSGKAKKEGHA